jgi:hypothetical protein
MPEVWPGSRTEAQEKISVSLNARLQGEEDGIIGNENTDASETVNQG